MDFAPDNQSWAVAGGFNYTRTVQADESGRPILEQWVLHEQACPIKGEPRRVLH